MAKAAKQPYTDPSDQRKFDVGDTVEYFNPMTREKYEHTVHAVRYSEDSDGIRHNYEYLMDTGEIEPGTSTTDEAGNVSGQPVLHAITASMVIRKV